MEHIKVHDFRRACRTILVKLGISGHVAELG